MNPLIEQASEAIGRAGMATIMTILFMAGFFAWVWYDYRPANPQQFEDADRLPFEEGGDC
jgi:cbb3-type cytochrome oxidase subunit 3